MFSWKIYLSEHNILKCSGQKKKKLNMLLLTENEFLQHTKVEAACKWSGYKVTKQHEKHCFSERAKLNIVVKMVKLLGRVP